MGKHAHQGSGAAADVTAAGDVTSTTDVPTPTAPTPTPDGTTTSGGMMRPDPYWGPHDEKA